MAADKEISKHKKKKPVLQKRPFALVYYIALFVIRIMCKLQFNFSYKGDKVKGPALILSNHTSNEDWKFIGVANPNTRISFLITYHFFTFKKLRPWLNLMGAIPKLQFTTDLDSMRKIRYIVQEKKGVVYIAPEGTVYSSGHLGYMSPAIAKLIKFLKVPVYTSKIQGAGLGNAKWSKFKHKGKVVVENKLLFTADDAVNLNPDEIMQRLTTELTYNEFDFQKDQNVLVKGNTKAEDFETMFYTCPCCNKEFTLKSSGNTIECTNCGTTATIQDDFTFKWNAEKQYFENYSQWYDWQYQNMLDMVQQPDFKLEEKMDYGIDIPGVNNYQKVGHGVLSFTHQGWDYKGTFNGQQFEDHDDIRAVFLATLKVGKHIELPHKDGHCRVFYPKNGLTSMKWHLASRAMSELKNQ